MDLMLNGRRAVLLGGASNMGWTVVQILAAEGADIGILDIDPEQANRAANKAKENGATGKIEVFATDARDVNQVQQSIAHAIESLGGVDILINIVGGGPGFVNFLDRSREDWEKEVALTFWGPVHATRAVLPLMVEQKYGRILSFVSDAGKVGEFKQAIYAGAKGGIIALSKSLAREFAKHNITVNCISPGMTIPNEREMVGELSRWSKFLEDDAAWGPEQLKKAAASYPLRRVGTPQDLANVAVFMVSDRCSFVTGQVWSVSGGFSMI